MQIRDITFSVVLQRVGSLMTSGEPSKNSIDLSRVESFLKASGVIHYKIVKRRFGVLDLFKNGTLLSEEEVYVGEI